MARIRVSAFAILMAVFMIGCGGSEYRFGNSRTLPNLSGKWTVGANSVEMAQQFAGTANVAQSNNGLQGTLQGLFSYCASSATVGGTLDPVSPFDATSVNSYSVDVVLQEAVGANSGPQAIELTGTASADGTHMSGTYTAYSGSCTSGDSGTWVANKTN